MEKGYNGIAEAISAVLSAPLVAIYTFILLIFFVHPSSPALLLTISIFFGSILPLVTILYMAKRGIIPDIYASDKETRTKPFIGAIVSYIVGAVTLIFIQAPQILVFLMVCYFVNSFVMMIITRIWKISIHISGVAGPATFLVHQFGANMLPFFMLLVPTAWARIKLGAHDLNQVTAGALLTIGLTLAQLELYSIL